MLSLDIRLRLGDFTLEVNEDIALSGVTAIFGRSGAGKSTLLRVIAGLERRASGRVALAGDVWQDARHRLAPEQRGVGYVFQDTRLFPHLSVRGNLDFALRRAAGLGGPGFDEVTEALDLGPLLGRRTPTLSGGEKQRVAIARALLTAPKILLMDEPLAALDEARKAEILPYLERLRDQAGVPILYVSHSLAEVVRLARSIVVLRDGRVLRAGTTEAVLSDLDAVPMFGGSEAGALVTGTVAGHEADGLTRLDIAAGSLLLPRVDAAVGSVLRLHIHAENVLLSRTPPDGLSALNSLPATVTALRPDGEAGMMVQLRLGDDLLLARITLRSAKALGLAPGVPCYAIVKSMSVTRDQLGVARGTPRDFASR